MCFNFFEIDTKALIENVKKIKLNLKDGCKLCAMVKADAYGHGVKNIAPYIDCFVDFFGVANTKEAMELRNLNVNAPIIVVGELSFEDILWCAMENVRLSIGSVDDAIKVSNGVNLPLKVHIKINSGMNRFGFDDERELKKAITILKKNKNITIEGVFTHYSTKEEDKKFIIYQTEVFYNLIKNINLKDVIIHTSSSYASLNMPSLNFDMCRIGFYLYGGEKTILNLSPVLSIKSQVVKIIYIKKGESVGYSRTFVAKRDSIIGVVPLGYADGFDRRLSNNGFVLINGKKAPIIGRICMDVFFVDLTNIDNVKLSTEVVIIGKSGKKQITFADYAKRLSTSEYEIMLKFRYKRMNVKIK